MKTNRQFMILSAIGILMVVDAHSWSALRLFTNVFPYNSFFMPMFIFISGYFFQYSRQKGFFGFAWKKVKKLLVPYFAFHILYGLIMGCLRHFTSFTIGKSFSLFNLFVNPWYSGEVFDVDNPSWFVPTLFMVVMVYYLIRIVFQKIWNEHVFLVLFFSLAAVSVALSLRGYNHHAICMPGLKVGFFLAFYQLGIWYRAKLEPHYSIKWQVCTCIAAVAVNVILVLKYQNINFGAIRMLAAGEYPFWVPLVTGVTGTFFWLVIAGALTPVLGENRFCNYISNHTFDIMMNHVFCMTVLNILLYCLNRVIALPGLDCATLKATAWYRYCPGEVFYFAYFAAGLAGSLLICVIREKGKKRMKERWNFAI